MSTAPEWEPCLQRDWPTYAGHRHTDVAVIGGGLTGVTTALMLSALGTKVILLERDRLGCGASWGCTGMMTGGAVQIEERIRRCAGRASAERYTQLIHENAAHLQESLARLSLSANLIDTPQGMTLSPMLYLTGMAEHAASYGCEIYEHSPVTALTGHRLTVAGGSVTASTIVIATGVPVNCTRLIPLALCEQHAFAVRRLAGQAACPQEQQWPRGFTARPLPDGLLVRCDLGRVGYRHDKRLDALSQDLQTHFPQMTVVESGFRQEVVSRDGLPIIGPISEDQPYLLMATGYSGLGLAGSFLAARVLTGHILAHPIQESALFAPVRGYPGGWMTVAGGLAQIASGYVRGLLHPRSPVCEHMGCRLQYRSETGRWECPCHGSSYDGAGRLYTAPASGPVHIARKHRAD